MTAPPALELDRVTRRFGAVTALREATLTVRPGTVHALLGENGAGKTTLMRIAFGLLRPDAGEVRVRGAPVRFASPADAIDAGLGMVHQHFTLVPAMTVAENVALAGRGRYDAARARARVRAIAAEAGLEIDPDARAGALGVSAQQRAEIVKALARDARVLVLDEPTAVLAPAEADALLAWLRRFADQGHAAVVITHKLREALAVADDVTVLRHGRTAATFGATATEADLARAMLGEGPGAEPAAELSEIAGISTSGARAAIAGATAQHALDPAAPPSAGAPSVLRVRDLVVRDARGAVRVRGVTFDLAPGEIVGLAAVEGAGHHELLRAVAGRLPATDGSVQRPASLGFVPEDRHRDALVLPFTLTENVALRGAGARRGRIPWRSLARTVADLLRTHDVRAADARVPVATLSGGNQQKLVLARELDGAPPLLVVENPTRGLDVRATAAVHQRLREARAAGTAVLLYSSDLDEVLALADRVLVMYAGQLHELPRDRARVGRAMLGLHE